MVIKQASPPMQLEIGSAQNTPSTPNPILGKSMVSGATITAFRSSEKNMACFEYPSAVKADCPVNWNAIKKNPKKYNFKALVPASSMAGSSVKIESSKWGHCITTSQASKVYKIPTHAVKRIPWHTRSNRFAP